MMWRSAVVEGCASLSDFFSGLRSLGRLIDRGQLSGNSVAMNFAAAGGLMCWCRRIAG